MNDYKELIAELKEELKEERNACDSLISDKIAINLGMLTEKYYVTLAEDCCGEMVRIMQTIDFTIDAIERLVNDYEVLAKMYAKVNEDLCVRTKERDAAVADLSMYGRYCVTCVGTHDMCDTCLFEDNWKWRGVQEDNDEID